MDLFNSTPPGSPGANLSHYEYLMDFTPREMEYLSGLSDFDYLKSDYVINDLLRDLIYNNLDQDSEEDMLVQQHRLDVYNELNIIIDRENSLEDLIDEYKNHPFKEVLYPFLILILLHAAKPNDGENFESFEAFEMWFSFKKDYYKRIREVYKVWQDIELFEEDAIDLIFVNTGLPRDDELAFRFRIALDNDDSDYSPSPSSSNSSSRRSSISQQEINNLINDATVSPIRSPMSPISRPVSRRSSISQTGNVSRRYSTVDTKAHLLLNNDNSIPLSRRSSTVSNPFLNPSPSNPPQGQGPTPQQNLQDSKQFAKEQVKQLLDKQLIAQEAKDSQIALIAQNLDKQQNLQDSKQFAKEQVKQLLDTQLIAQEAKDSRQDSQITQISQKLDKIESMINYGRSNPSFYTSEQYQNLIQYANYLKRRSSKRRSSKRRSSKRRSSKRRSSKRRSSKRRH